jgi:hypothetical protein
MKTPLAFLLETGKKIHSDVLLIKTHGTLLVAASYHTVWLVAFVFNFTSSISKHMVLAEIYTGIQYVIGAAIAQARDWASEETWFIFQQGQCICLSPKMFRLSCDPT